MALQSGTRLGPYEVISVLGAGGMGEVYKARDTRLERTVAIKVLPESVAADEALKRRLTREAKTISSLNHPHICTLHDIGEQDGLAYLVMEHVEGETLADRLRRHGAFPIADAVRYGDEIASALERAHQQGIVHRDLKPGNVMLTDAGVKVLDFGIATRVESTDLDTLAQTVTATGLGDAGGIAGTVPYMAPETLRGEPSDARSDIWALGILLYEMVGGRRPFVGSTGVDVTSAIMRDAPSPLSESVPVGLQNIIGRCLEKDPGRRYQRAGEVRAALQAATSQQTVLAARQGPRLSRRVAMAGAAAIGIALLGWGLLGGRDNRESAVDATARIALAVLPFDTLSSGVEQGFMAEGMTDAVITELSRIGGLNVTSRTSVMRYQNSAESMSDIARALGVETIVGGSVAVAGDQVRVTAQLVNVGTGQILWAESYDRGLQDVLAVQSEIARAVADEIQVTVTPEEAASLASTRPVNPRAYEAYLEGEYHARRYPTGLSAAVAAFEQSIAEDPGFAPAYAGLSVSYTTSAFYGSSLPLPYAQRLPRAKETSERALELEPTLAKAHTASAMVKMAYERDFVGAKVALDRASELDPDDVSLRDSYANYLCWVEGRTEDAVEYARETLAQDPLSLDLNTRVGMLLYFARDYEAAITQLTTVLQRSPDYSDASTWLRHSLVELGRIDELEPLIGPTNILPLALGYYRVGRFEDARRVLQEASAGRPASAPAPTGFFGALGYSMLGDMDQAFVALNDLENRDAPMLTMRVDPRLDQLRDDPRFDEVLARMNFP